MPAPKAPDDFNRLQAAVWRVVAGEETAKRKVAAQLQKDYTRAYLNRLRERLQTYGCVGERLSSPQRRVLIEWSREDAESIIETKNKALANVIRDITQDTTLSRPSIERRLRAWSKRYNSNRSFLIARNTTQKARVFADELFEKNNGLEGEFYVYGGRHPNGELLVANSSATCRRRVALGVVDAETRRKESGRPHPRCPHEWQQVTRNIKLTCRNIWRG